MARAVAVALLACAWVACGDDANLPGCGSDMDCKGDRICVQGQCVDPGGLGGAGGSASGGTGGGRDGGAAGANDAGTDADTAIPPTGELIDDPLLEAACIADCEAKHAAECEMPIGSLDQCMGQCLVIDENGHGYCRAEQRAHYDCLAAGGYTCAAGYPQPKATCIEAATALAACNQQVPCRQFCDVAKGKCAPGGAKCFETCSATLASFDDLSCSYDYNGLLTCWTQHLVCDSDRPSVVGCEEEAVEVADCVGRRQTDCDGYCWLLDLLGCGMSNCVTSCTMKVEHPSCGYRYESLLRCAHQSNELNVTCAAGTPVFGEACESARTDHEMCIENL